MAAAFGMSMVRNPELEELMRASFGARLHERDLRMADIPEAPAWSTARAARARPGRWWWCATSGFCPACP